MISPVFSQNIYQGVFEDLPPTEAPEDISMFEINADKYPLLDEVKDYIKTVKVAKGDCIYIPNYYFYQFRTTSKSDSIFLGFEYDTSSKLTELFIEAIHAGVLEKA